MLEKTMAAKLKAYICNHYGTTRNLESLDLLDCKVMADSYVFKHYSVYSQTSDMFSPETIAYTYALLQGLK